MPSREKLQVFISHADEDRQVAERIYSELFNCGFEPFLAPAARHAGDAWWPQIRRQIAEADFFVFLMSHYSLDPHRVTWNEWQHDQKVHTNPVGRVVPVPLVDPKSLDKQIPGYLHRVTFASHYGDPAITVTEALNELRDQRKQSQWGGPFATPQDPKPVLSLSDEALRSFVQRGEVRLSTMHRIGAAFISGAGLLVLFPILLKDNTINFLSILFGGLRDLKAVPIESNLWGIGLLCSLYLPLYSLYVLYRDLIKFYFTPNTTEEIGNTVYPRFSLAALSFPGPWTDVTKQEVLARTYSEQMIRFATRILPLRGTYYRKIQSFYPGIIPEKRRDFIHYGPSRPADSSADFYSIACGIAGLEDRELALEAARLEVSLVRHNIALRNLVLRYSKALIALIWTAVILFLAGGIIPHVVTIANWFTLKALPPELVNVAALNVIFLIWALGAPILVRFPIAWIYKMGGGAFDLLSRFDAEMRAFEIRLIVICAIGFFASGVGLYYSLHKIFWMAALPPI